VSEHHETLEREAEVRRNILRRASLFSYGMLAVTIGVALGGAALIALVLKAASGLPFLETWGVLSALVLVPPLLRIAFRALRGRT
jgi:uncharacterized membrane protein